VIPLLAKLLWPFFVVSISASDLLGYVHLATAENSTCDRGVCTAKVGVVARSTFTVWSDGETGAEISAVHHATTGQILCSQFS